MTTDASYLSNTVSPIHLSHKTDLTELTREELTEFVTSQNLPAFRAKQIFSWLYRSGINDFSQMTNLSKELRTTIAQKARIGRLTLSEKEVSVDGTIKYCFRLADGKMIESVLIPEDDRHTLCVSSQVGCAMGCVFCLTATMGFIRNLTCAEIVGQVVAVLEELQQREAGTINNLVFMGMGEPLANFDILLKSLNILMDDLGLNFAERRITVSTCGLVPEILKLGGQTNVNLAISLHAADDATRNRLMPINSRYPIAELLDTCRSFPLSKRKRIMFEYILLKGINDSDQDARKLAKILRGIPCKINLLPCNEAPQIPFEKPDDARIESFQNILRKNKYTVLLRTSRGADISAACGQLAVKKLQSVS